MTHNKKRTADNGRKGQIESSFQWIYVLVAGGSFLIIFFFLIRGCTDQNQDETSAYALSQTANKLSTAVLQGNTQANTTLAESRMRCPAGTLAVTSKERSSPVASFPIFTPQYVGGTAQLRSEDVFISTANAPPIRVGNVLYVIDQDTFYYVEQDVAIEHPKALKAIASSNVRVVPLLSAVLVPDGAKHVVFVTKSGFIPTPPDPRISVVKIDGQTVAFGTSPAQMETAETEVFVAGAIITADTELYRCAKDDFAGRARLLLNISQSRLKNALLDPSCVTPANSQKDAILTLLSSTDNNVFLNKLFTTTIDPTKKLLAAQYALYATSHCPVT